MAEDIIIRYRAETDELIKEINTLIDKQDQLADEAERTSKTFDKAATNEVQAAKRRQQAIQSELQNIEKLKASRARAFDPVLIDRFNKAIRQSEDRIKSLGSATEKESKKIVSTFSSAGSQIKNIGLGIAAGFGAAFSIDAIVSFTKASVAAFIDAEKNAEKLKFAITSIGGESEEAFNRLIKQSAELQKITIFSDDAIQQAQAALSAFGLTADQIEDLIPKLADFATVTGQDIVSATQQVGAGLEGAGREFKKYGIEVSATASRQENLNSILNGFGKFAGAASEATKTLSGEQQVLNNRIDDLQESIGEKLAPTLKKTQLLLFEFFNSLLGGNERDKQFNALRQSIQGIVTDLDEVAETIVDNGAAYGLLDEIFNRKSIGVYENTLAELTQTIITQRKEAEKNIKTIQDVNTEGFKFAKIQGEIKKAFDEGRLSQEGFNTANRIYQENLKKLGSALVDYQNKIKKQQQADAEAAKKIQDEQKKISDDTVKNIDNINEILSITSLEYQNLTDQQRLLLTLWEKSQGNIGLLRDEVAKLNKEFQSQAIDDFEKKLKELNNERLRAAEIPQAEPPDSQKWIEKNNEILQSSLDLFNELSSIYSTFSDVRIDQLEKSSEAFNERLNAEDEALQESKDKRLISEAEYRKQSDAIEAKRVENEKRIRDAINKERKKQAILNKANALFEIALNTAMAIAKVSAQLGVAAAPFIALVAALGAAQAAAVVAQPIPAFAKGTKGKKGSGMALVGEQGPEITYVPDGAKILPAKQTKTYGEVFDAMYDNKFEKYVYNKFVAPALEEQKRKYAENKSANFAENIVTSMQYNGITTNDLLYANRKGTNIKNADEIAQAIAKALKTSSPDLWRM